jgi:hypothetical protein
MPPSLCLEENIGGYTENNHSKLIGGLTFPFSSQVQTLRLAYAMVCTRSHIAHAVGFLRRYMSKPRSIGQQ